MQGHRSVAVADPGAAPPDSRRPWAVLILLSVAQFMVVLDMTVVNVALPAIGSSLRFAPGDLQWVVTAYVLVSGGLVLLGGRASDVLGRRRVFLAGLALFTASSLASGLAPAPGVLIAARAGQGLGAALLTPAALSIITTVYTGGQRATALALWGAIGSGGAAGGVLAGGMLTTWLGWRSVFLVNVPIGLVVGLLSPRLVPRPEAAAPDGRRLDLPGAVLVVAGLITGVYALAGTERYGWGAARTLALFGAALVLLAAFAVTERRTERPLLPPFSHGDRPLIAGALLMFGATGVLIGAFFLNSIFFQRVLGASPLLAGLEFLPIVAAIGLGSHLTARILPRAGTRLIAASGLALMSGGSILLSSAPDHASYWTGLLPGLVGIAIGAGLVFPAASITGMSEVSSMRAGRASGLMLTAHEVGAALGVAVFSALATAQAAAGGGFAAGYRHGFAVAAGIAAGLALLAAITVPAVRPAPGAKVTIH